MKRNITIHMRKDLSPIQTIDTWQRQFVNLTTPNNEGLIAVALRNGNRLIETRTDFTSIEGQF